MNINLRQLSKLRHHGGDSDYPCWTHYQLRNSTLAGVLVTLLAGFTSEHEVGTQ